MPSTSPTPCPTECCGDEDCEQVREACQKKIADLETLSQLALPSPPLSPIETFLIETFLVLFDPSPRSLQLRHNLF